MRKKGKIPIKVYEALRSIGSHPASLNGLAKSTQRETPLRLVLSILGSCYHKLNNFLTPFLQKVERATIETKTNDARKTLEQTKLEREEQFLSLGVKKFIQKRSRKGSH